MKSLEDLKMLLLNFNFVMIYIIRKNVSIAKKIIRIALKIVLKKKT